MSFKESTKTVNQEITNLLENDVQAKVVKKEERVPNPKLQKIKSALSKITIEPLTFFYMLPMQLSIISNENMNLQKACIVNLRYNETVCKGLAELNRNAYAVEHEDSVQALVAGLKTYKTLFDGCVPFVMLILWGSWSDRNNRKKPVLMLPLMGEIIATIGYILCVYYFVELPVEYSIFFETVPGSTSGGQHLMYMALFSYVGLISTVKMRTIRMGVLSVSARISLTLGMAVSGLMYRYTGFYGVYISALVLLLMGPLYLLFFVNEIPDKNADIEKKKVQEHSFMEFISFENVKAVALTVCKARKNRGKAKLIILLLASVLTYGTHNGEFTLTYIFTRKHFQWNELDYSIYSTVQTIIQLVGCSIGLAIFAKYLKFDDVTLAIISIISKILGSTVQLLAPTGFIFYIGCTVALFHEMILIVTRSMISKIVSKNELGKANTAIGLINSLAPMIIGSTYTLVYKNFISVYPPAIFAVTIFYNLPCLFIFYWLYKEAVKDRKQSVLAGKEQQ